jgi:superfamily II DNA or RNA helicase
MARVRLRAWQEEATTTWIDAGHRGIVAVVTGGGKTVFALACVERLRPQTVMVVVPTVALLDQWWEEAASYFNVPLEDIHVVSGTRGMKTGTINLAVLNTAAELPARGRTHKCMLIVDECHKAASPLYKKVLDVATVASLGLSATPERPYDSGLENVLVPALGPVIYRYSYKEALRDGVIVPFKLKNIVFELEDDKKVEYAKLTKAIARAIDKHGVESPEVISLFIRRARALNLSLNRVRLAVKLVAANRGRRILVFHEDIEACNLIYQVLAENGVSAGVYHSKMRLKERVAILAAYRHGKLDVLVTCRALDEGFNVPETEIGIIAASTATQRQRIQRLGRVLRPASGKDGASVYTLVATDPEVARLKKEEKDLEGVADVSWAKA